MGAVGGFEVSPDGRCLLWEAYFGHGAAPPSVRVAHLDGTGYRAWDYDKYEERFFLDSRHLVQTQGYVNAMVVSDLQYPQKDRRYRTLAQAQEAITRYAEQQPVWITVERHGDKPPGDGLAEIETYRTQDRIQAAQDDEREVQKSPEPLRTHLLALPSGAAIQDTEVSSQQQSILYDLQITQQNPLISWLHRLFSKIAAEPTLKEGFWVSRADGGGMREIGEVSLPWSAHDSFESTFGDIHWLPDGKQISFVYHGMLYVAPAEPEKQAGSE